MSPEYCVMMSRAFNEIQKNRLMLNIIPGNLTSGENSINNTIYISEKINSREKILEYTEEWIKKFTELYIYENRPEIGVSGHSPKSVEIARKYADYHITAYNHLKDFVCKKNIVCAPVIIGNKKSDIESIIKEKNQHIDRVIYGSKQEVYEKIMGYCSGKKNYHIEFMFWGFESDKKNWDSVHEVSKMLMGEKNA